MRTIRTGRGGDHIAMKPADIAGQRSMLLDTREERDLFRDAFRVYRRAAARLYPRTTSQTDIEALAFAARAQGPVYEAAMIEALASLRAEGIRL